MKITPELLDKYLAGQCSETEKKEVEAWYASLDAGPDFLGTLPGDERQALQENTFENILSEIRQNDGVPARRIRWGWLSGIAASIALAAGLFLYQKAGLQPAPAARVQPPDAASGENLRFANEQAQIVTFMLPDSSTVQMRPGAEITYPKQFEAGRRRVSFSGEGFFNVKKDKTRPFLISSGEMMIRVLGTSFNVNASLARQVFQIDVVTGSVQVTAPDLSTHAQQVVLKPRQQAIFETISRKLTARAIDPEPRREIYESVSVEFEETPLGEVVKQLQERFNIRISLAEPRLAACTLTARFNADPLPIILEMLCTSLDATYAITGSEVTINGPGCD